ncbi:MAG: hypothetical protein LBT79_05695, partial [Elusimicrobiota bacterium]|nr:hypothetical protein [Elusimicrobiota bacterium]
SKKSVNISDIDSANGLRADFKYDFEKDLLSATMRFKNSEISNIYEGLTKGTLNMEVKISKAPRLKINANASIRKGVYMKFPFLLDLNASYDNNEILINNLNISGNNAKIKAKGKYAKLNNIEFSFENITKEISDKFVNIKIPIKSGTFFGEGRLYNNYGGDSVQMVLRGSDTVVSNIKINSFTADIDINKSLVSAGSVSAKIAGGEIKMQSAVFDIKSGKYFLNFELINANAGFLNLFGKISVDGNADDNAFSGTVYLDDLWINKYKISKFDMKYRVEGSSVDLSARNSKNAFIFNASAFIDLKPSVTIRNFYLSYANTMFLAEGIIDRNDFRTNIRGSNIDLDIICDILNSPIDMEGKANFIFHSSSSFKDPLINMTLNVVNGSVARVPYDAANISFNVKQNAAELSARISKRNELDVSIDASFPFWLDDSIRDAMRKRAVNIKYDLTNSNLSILKYLSDDFIEPKSGKILLRGSITGSLEEMSNSGLFTISAGVLSFKEYLPRMKDIDIDILFKDNDIEIRKFSAKSPKGIFKMTGSLNIEDFEIREFNIRAFSEDGGIPIQVPDLSIPSSIISEAVLKDISKAEPTFDISIIGPADKPNIAGKIILENARFNYPSVSGQGADFSFIPPNAQIDIDLITGKNTNFENAYVNARIDGNIKFSGTAAALQKQGIINIQRGVLNYLGAGFDIVSAKIEIIDNMVYVSGESKTDVYSPGGKTPDEVKLSISRSDTQHLNISLTSRDNPSMNSETVLAKVLGISVSGDANNQTDDKKSAAADETNWTGLTDFEIRQQAVRLINSNFVVPLAKTILRRTGIVDNLKVSYVETTASNSSAENGANSSDGSSENAANDETFSETGNNSLANFLYGTKYTVEKNITNQMAIGYSLLFDQLNNELDLRHGIEMTYRLTDNLSLTGNYELQSENLLRQPDRRIMLRHQLRFGGNIPQKQNNNANDAALDNK